MKSLIGTFDWNLCSKSGRSDIMRRNPWARTAAFSAIFLAAIIFISVGSPPAGAQQPWGANYVPNHPFPTQDGTTVHLYDHVLKGKIVVIDLIYTHSVD